MLAGEMSVGAGEVQYIADGRRNCEPLKVMIVLLIIVNLLSMVICYQVARSRKADRWYWLILGLLLGPFAVPFVFFARPNQS
jgi:hypothetical protein